MATVTCVVDCRCWLGEGPCWVAREGALYWTDVPSRRVHRWRPGDGEHRTWETPDFVTALTPRRQGGLVAALRDRVAFFDPETGGFTPFVAPEADRPENRSNDGKCDRQGRFWYGTMRNNLAPDGGEIPIEGEPAGSLYRIDPDGCITRVDGPFGISNTLAWSPDDRTMYFGDTLDAIYAYGFDPASGTMRDRRVHARRDAAPGFADGSAIDAEGCLWNCRWDGGAVVRLGPGGEALETVPLPCSRVTSACFGGPDLTTLYVTTARHGLGEAEPAGQPLAGGIFAIETGARGLPDGEFAG
jgi:L-arabinonolactonase